MMSLLKEHVACIYTFELALVSALLQNLMTRTILHRMDYVRRSYCRKACMAWRLTSIESITPLKVAELGVTALLTDSCAGDTE
jgi:hypothetical protein